MKEKYNHVIQLTLRPPLGLMPKKIHDEFVKIKRFGEVCEVIIRFYNAGLKIDIEWVEEYNELVDCVGNFYEQKIQGDRK